MKKIYFVMMSLMMMMASSCSNDGIEVDKVISLSVNVSTSATYESFGKTKFETLLSKASDNHIGVFSYLYNEEGDLVASDTKHTKTMEQVQQSFVVNLGKYTLVTVETFVTASTNYQSDYWSLENMDKLSTCQLRLKSENGGKLKNTSENAVVGIDVRTVELNSNTSVNVMPNPKGSLVNVRYYNFEYSDYNYLGFVTKNIPIGYRLDPSLSGSDRYLYGNYNEDKSFQHRMGVNDPTLKSSFFDVYLLEDMEVNWGVFPSVLTGGNLKDYDVYPNKNTIKDFKDGKTYYAGFYYMGNVAHQTECKAGLFESEAEFSKWLDEAKSLPSEALFQEPYQKVKADVQTVKAYMRGFTMTQDIKQDEDNKSYYYMIFKGKDFNNRDMNYRYHFESATSGLLEAFVYVDKMAYGFESIRKHLEAYGFTYDSPSTSGIYKFNGILSDVTVDMNKYDNYVQLKYGLKKDSKKDKE